MPFSARVLVLDTDGSHPLSVTKLLNAHGYRGLFANTIEDAARLANDSFPDVAVVNATAKDLNGGSLIQSLKAAWPSDHMPLILVGDHSDVERQTLDLVEGMADFLPNPFEDFELTARLASLSRLSTMQSELARRQATARKFGVGRAALVESEAPMDGGAIVLLARREEDGAQIAKAFRESSKVRVVDSTFTAMNHLSTGPADAFVVALSAGDNEAIEFCSYIRRNPRLYNLPILAVIDKANGFDLSEIYFAGVNEVVSQPLHEADLRIRTEALIRQNTYRIAMREGFRNVRDTMTSDSLTGLYSYGFVHQHLSDLVDAATAREKNLTVALLNVQGVHDVNREHGYSGGDKILRQIGALLGSLVRGEDILGRHGGDQFCLILPDTDVSDAKPVLQRIAGVLNNTEFNVAESGEPVTVRLRAGVTGFEPGDTAESLILRAQGG